MYMQLWKLNFAAFFFQYWEQSPRHTHAKQALYTELCPVHSPEILWLFSIIFNSCILITFINSEVVQWWYFGVISAIHLPEGKWELWLSYVWAYTQFMW